MAKVRTASGRELEVGRVGDDVEGPARRTGKKVHFIDRATGAPMVADAGEVEAWEAQTGGPVERVTAQEAEAKAAAMRDAGQTDVSGALRAGVVGAGSGVMDVVLAAPKLATSAYSAATGEADPLADVNGRTGLAGIAYTLGELGGQTAAEGQALFERSMGEQRRLATEHGTATAVGRVAGEALPLLATGGLAGAGRLGSRIALGAAEGFIGGVAATEEDAFLQGRDPAKLGDRIAGGLMGAVLGGGLVGAGSLASPLMRGAGRATDSLAARVFGAADEAVDGIGSAAGGGTRAFADRQANRLVMAHLTEGRNALTRKAGGEAGEEAIARVLRRENIIGDGAYDGIARRAEGLAERAGARMDDALRQLDDAGARVNGGRLARAVEEAGAEFTSKTSLRTTREAWGRIASNVDEAVEAANRGEWKFSDLHKLRTSIDKQINWAGKANDQSAQDMWRTLRGAVEDNIQGQADEAIDAASRAAGGAANDAAPAWSSAWKAAKADYRAAAFARDAAAEQLKRGTSNRAISLTDTIVGAGALGGTIATGGLSGGVLMGAAGAVGNKLFRRYANPLGAAVADRIARGSDAAISGAVSQFFGRAGQSTGNVARALRSAAGGMVDAPRKVAQQVAFAGKGESDSKAYARRAQQLAQVSSNPEALEARIRDSLGDLPSTAPRTAAAVAMRQRQAVAFLASKVPAALNSPGVTPQLFQPRVQPSDLARFRRYWEGVADPMRTVEGIGEGRISREGVEALRACYPEIFAETQAQLMAGLAALTRPLPSRQAVELEIVMGMNGASWPMLAPAALAAQATIAPAAAAAEKAKGGAPTRVVRIAQQFTTPTTGGLKTS